MGIATLKLIISPLNAVVVKAKELIAKTREQIPEPVGQRNLIELIETIIVYKFPTLGREEIETMLGLGDLRQSKVYLEGKQEGFPRSGSFDVSVRCHRPCQSLNMSELPEEQVRKIAPQNP